jgi:hypothetical protein
MKYLIIKDCGLINPNILKMGVIWIIKKYNGFNLSIIIFKGVLDFPFTKILN